MILASHSHIYSFKWILSAFRSSFHGFACEYNINLFIFLLRKRHNDSRTFAFLFEFQHKVSWLSNFSLYDIFGMIKNSLIEKAAASGFDGKFREMFSHEMRIVAVVDIGVQQIGSDSKLWCKLKHN